MTLEKENNQCENLWVTNTVDVESHGHKRRACVVNKLICIQS